MAALPTAATLEEPFVAPDFTLPCSPPDSTSVTSPQLSTPFSSQNALRAAAEAKVGCLSLSWQPAVEERHLTSASSPPSRRVIILRLVSSRMMTTSARFHMLNTLFMELVNALIDGAAKKGLMMTASQPLLHLHCTNTYIYGTQIH